MNASQRIVLALAAITITLMVIFPPWLFVYDFPGEDRTMYRHGGRIPAYYTTRFAGYHAITGQNAPTDQTYLVTVFGLESNTEIRYFSMRIDKDRLWIQLAGALAVTLLLVFLLKSRPSEGQPTH
jgi:hypothetical protein